MANDALQKVGVRFLTPGDTRLFIGRLGSLHCIIDKIDAYANVYCILTFPIHLPKQYISVQYSDDEGKEHEIGVIKVLEDFPKDAQELVLESLRRQYFEQVITRIHEVKSEFGLLFFDVEIGERRVEFNMRWQHDKALEYGKQGKVLLDTFENRYVIPKLEDLPQADRNRLLRYIYW
ncbi:DUF1854 domain-containing protein [candidate division KSB1 bacterium]|nr:DUF1854 domain-containing protein [candidate division KSB1 bacterium]